MSVILSCFLLLLVAKMLISYPVKLIVYSINN